MVGDHPRIRGEHFLWWWSLSEAAGSSPHTRGAPSATSSSTLRRRIIPAYAGSTVVQAAFGGDRRDHPRIRGEHTRISGSNHTKPGSSPHTRGAPDAERGEGLLERIIPAYAGSTCCSFEAAPTAWDHPRIRGEHAVTGPAESPGPGSSPHTRGAPPEAARQDGLSRIIPAYAGST